MTRSAFVSTYPPRHCGIATFTQHLATAVGGREIVALHASDLPSPYALEVHHRLRTSEPEEFPPHRGDCGLRRRRLHPARVRDLGARRGTVLEFVRALEVPAVATLHTVPASPTPEQHHVIAELAANVAGRGPVAGGGPVLAEVYGLDPAQVTVIPHGIPDLPLLDAETVKPAVGMGGRDVLLSFGLLAPGKGIELPRRPPRDHRRASRDHLRRAGHHPSDIRPGRPPRPTGPRSSPRPTGSASAPTSSSSTASSAGWSSPAG